MAKESKKIEPKTYFANERTYLQWFNAAAMLGSVSLGLVGFTTTSRVIGLIFLPISICLMLYALYMYHKRLRSIEERRGEGFHDPYGPTVLTIVLAIAMSIAGIISLTRTPGASPGV